MSTRTSTTTTVWEWPATGTTWRIHHGGGVIEALAAAVARAVERDEARWSRFRPDSEVSRVNAAGGSWVAVSADTLRVLEACVTWADRTDGVFQPLVGGALVAWGYHRSLLDTDAFAASSPAPRRLDGRIEVDRNHGTVRIPRGTRLDLGGIAKSWMAGRAAAVLCARCDDPTVIVDAGGDLVAARGDHIVAVEAPGPVDLRVGDARSLPVVAHVIVRAGQGVATSGFGRRRWRNGDGTEAHHLIDPTTGAPGPATHATVVSDDPVAADVLAKVLALRPDRIESTSEAARVSVGGAVRTTRRWERVVLP
ncbi:MAG: FAD:protein FMN transferase [Gaiellales bacterium]